MDIYVPAPPNPSLSDVDRYTSQLFPHETDDELHMLHMGVHCLNFAETTDNLAQYILTYAALFNTFTKIKFRQSPVKVAWIETLAHINRWHRILDFRFSIKDAYLPRTMTHEYWSWLQDYGIKFNLEEETKSLSLSKSLIVEIDYPGLIKNQFPNIKLSCSTDHVADLL